MSAIKAGNALLEITNGRQRIAKRIDNGERIPVVIRGFIDEQWAQIDEAAIEFVVDVSSLEFPEDTP